MLSQAENSGCNKPRQKGWGDMTSLSKPSAATGTSSASLGTDLEQGQPLCADPVGSNVSHGKHLHLVSTLQPWLGRRTGPFRIWFTAFDDPSTKQALLQFILFFFSFFPPVFLLWYHNLYLNNVYVHIQNFLIFLVAQFWGRPCVLHIEIFQRCFIFWG